MFADVADDQIVGEESCSTDHLSSRPGTIREARPAADRGSWDGRAYAIHSPKPVRELPPIRATASKYETADIIIERPEPIPMPGRPSNFETVDIVRPSLRHSSVAALHRFSLRREGRMEASGATLSQLMTAIRRHPTAAIRRTLEISPDGANFVGLPKFSELTELDMISGEEELPSGAYVGALAETSVASMFARIHEHKSTGRLVFTSPFGDRKLRTEIQVVRGAPTRVSTSEPSLETPSQLIRYRLVDSEDMRAAVWASTARQVPFVKLISQRVGVQVQKLALRFASERLEPLAAQQDGVYAFASTTPEHTQAFASSLLPILPGMYRRGATITRLRGLLAPYITQTFLRTKRFDSWLPELRLTNVESFAVMSFGYTRTLAQAIGAIKDERFGLSIAHLLIELGMIAPVA
jgi:hypothetical protein